MHTYKKIDIFSISEGKSEVKNVAVDYVLDPNERPEEITLEVWTRMTLLRNGKIEKEHEVVLLFFVTCSDLLSF
jgi:hypothetical protein